MTDRLSLIDGRVLSWHEFGDPRGRPLLCFHGNPDAGTIFTIFDAAAREAGVRIVAPDRPGFGRSDFVPGRSILDHADDVDTLADSLGLGRFAVLGISAGLAHTLGVAVRSRRRVTRITSFAGFCPESPDRFAGMAPLLGMSMHLFERRPRLTRPVISAQVALAHRRPDLALKLLTATRPDGDKAVLRRPEMREMMRAHLPNQFVSAEAIVDGYVQQVRPWPIAFGSIDQPAVVWQGGRDDVHPPQMGEFLARVLPNAELRLEPERCTFDFIDLFPEMLDRATA